MRPLQEPRFSAVAVENQLKKKMLTVTWIGFQNGVYL